MKRLVTLFISALLVLAANGQGEKGGFQFAQITDTHIGSSSGAADLRRSVKDINNNDSIAFVLITGDITEFGSDTEFILARQILDSLNKPWYIIPGNHDTKWSESGGNSFRKVFGAETFSFVYNGFHFIGTNSGPNMRMGPGQIPIENVVWLDSVVMNNRDADLPVIYANHYPAAEDLNNWYEAIDRLKTTNIQLALCGHGHVNKLFSAEGIPGIMGRSDLRAKDSVGGYNIMHIYGDSLLTASERHPGVNTSPAWCSVRLYNHHFQDSISNYRRPDFSVNEKYINVKETWCVKEKSDIGSGVAVSGQYLISTNTAGMINAYDISTGKLLWQYSTGSKIYSTPVISGEIVLEAATNGNIYALKLKTGRLIWSYDTGQPVVASPVVSGENVFIAGSWGKCFSFKVKTGRLNWQNDEIKGFVETIPLTYKGMIIFGTWANHLYALDMVTGKIRWDWHTTYGNRMLSPAACVPVAVGNRVFVVAPDRKMACIDALSGETIWHSDLGGVKVRESMGISADSTLIYAKTMNGKVIAVSATLNEGKVIIVFDLDMVYDIAPTAIIEKDDIVFIPSDKGFIYALDRNTDSLLWAHRVSSCLINQILPFGGRSVICTAMDGVITRIDY